MPLIDKFSKPYGPVLAGSVAPHSDITGTFNAAAMCIKPVSGPTANLARAIIPMASRKLVPPPD